MPLSADKTTLADLLRDASHQLKNNSDSPLLDAQLLLAHTLGKDRSYLLAWPEVTPTQQQQDLFQGYILQRKTDIPIAYILGIKEFWSMDFVVTPDVLIPRPDTELLVELIIDACSDIKAPKILELGTGSGAIAIALASELPNAQITATDLSTSALSIARQNSSLNRTKQIHFIQSDWFKDIPADQFDFIVSNPPYIEENDPHLLADIRHEPLQALVSGKDGLKDIRNILATASSYLKPQGRLFFEHGYNQAPSIKEMMESSGFTHCRTDKDYAGNDRVTSGCWLA